MKLIQREQYLEKIINDHPIVPLIQEYRNLTKLQGTYVEGLKNYIMKDIKSYKRVVVEMLLSTIRKLKKN